MAEPLPPEEIEDLDYTQLRAACKARDISAGGSADVLRDRLLDYWHSTTSAVAMDADADLTPLDAYADSIVGSVNVSRFETPGKQRAFAARAMRRTGGVLVEGVPDSEILAAITAAYERAK